MKNIDFPFSKIESVMVEMLLMKKARFFFSPSSFFPPLFFKTLLHHVFAFIHTFTASLAFTSSSASPPSPLSERSVIRPSQDPFYQAPPGFEHAALGTILRYRTPPSPIAVIGGIALNLQAAYQVQFRTTATIGNPQAAITTILIPHNANYSRLVSYQDFEDSAYLDCATSFALQATNVNSTFSQISFVLAVGLLEEGFIVNIPDAEGPQSAYFSGLQAGQATLDSIRAVLQSSDFTGIADDVDILLWGYSGGSIGTEFAAELQPNLCPRAETTWCCYWRSSHQCYGSRAPGEPRNLCRHRPCWNLWTGQCLQHNRSVGLSRYPSC